MRPISLTISLTNQCNHRCKTCFVYEHLQDDLSVEEYERIFRSIGRGVYYLTISGGEPFLRQDIVEICRLAKAYLDPKVLIIPTNGYMDRIIPERVGEIVEIFRGSQVVINLSVDGIGSQHDVIRGRDGAFDRAMRTFRRLRRLEAVNLTRGIHTVVSKLNVRNIAETFRHLSDLAPDSLICEVAERREELFTTTSDITPDPNGFEAAVDAMLGEMGRRNPRGLAKLIAAFRSRYQRNAVRILRTGRQYPPCQAGFMLAHVSPSGELWACCTEARSFGNLREHDYDWDRVFHGSPERHRIRGRIRRGECACPLANAGYVNILFHPSSLARVAWTYLRG